MAAPRHLEMSAGLEAFDRAKRRREEAVAAQAAAEAAIAADIALNFERAKEHGMTDRQTDRSTATALAWSCPSFVFEVICA